MFHLTFLYKDMIIFILFITISSNILFKTDYFYQRSETGHHNTNYYNETAQSSLVKCLTNVFVIAPLTLYFGGPLIALTPISVGILNGYIYHGSTKRLKRVHRKPPKIPRKRKRKRKNHDVYYKSRYKMYEQVKGIIMEHKKVSKTLEVVSYLNFLLIFLSISYRNKYWVSFFLISFMTFSFVSTFYLTFKNEMNKIELDKLYMFDEYIFECLQGDETSNFESFVESFNSNFRIAVGLNKGNYETIEGVKLNNKCLGLLKRISKIEISIPKVFIQMFIDLFVTIWVKLFERFSKVQLIIIGGILGGLCYTLNPIILNFTLLLFNKKI